MKVTKEHADHMKAAIDKLLDDKGRDTVLNAYETGNFARAERVKDLQKRFCFDLMHGAGLTKWVCDTVYPYANDDHLFTALKSICPTVTQRY